jgi:hypothetical protein
MKKRILDKLLTLLGEHYSEFRWCGRRLGKSPYASYGSFTAHTAHVCGFEIRIVSHNYPSSRFPQGIPNRVTYRRNIPDGILHWIELTIKDEFTRYGRRYLLNKGLFLPGTRQYVQMQNIFKKIEKVSPIFDPKQLSRLSEDQSLIGFCKEIAKATTPP